jgi:hypothetical protein
MTWFGLIGGPLIILSGIGTLFDLWGPGTTVPALATIPEFIWELFLGIYCTIWGFRRDAPILRVRNESHQRVATTGGAA